MDKVICTLVCLLSFNSFYQVSPPVQSERWDFDNDLVQYFEAETKRITRATTRRLQQITDWKLFRTQAVLEARTMLGLNPWPERSPLNIQITGVVEHPDFIVEKLHFQSLDGLYVTGNLYRPKNIDRPVPAILYVCGHSNVVEQGISYGSKTVYQHHPAWFARHGYICLILDTLQLGEIEGIHHGLYRYDRWWWMSKGFTPAGIETWNGIRAIDYLTGREDVQPDKIGITGRSGGGATSWWVAAIDERIKAAVPVAGITDLTNHVIDGCVDGHCDCMYFVNTFQWDYPLLAALIAPRPLLISNTDRDPIFPLDGVYRTCSKVRKVYDYLGVPDNLALNVAAGPHRDIQSLRIHAFHWFDKFLLDRNILIDKAAVKYFEPKELKVFDQLPHDEVNTRIDEFFIPTPPSARETLTKKSWEDARQGWLTSLEEKTFAGWPAGKPMPSMDHIENKRLQNISCTLWQINTDAHTKLPLLQLRSDNPSDRGTTHIYILDDTNWKDWVSSIDGVFNSDVPWHIGSADPGETKNLTAILKETDELILISTRGTGPAHFSGDKLRQTQIQRRYYLLGQTLHSMQTWDILQGIRAVQAHFISRQRLEDQISVFAENSTAVMLAYASLFTEQPLRLNLKYPPQSHLEGPHYLNVLRYMDVPAAILMAAEKHSVTIETASPNSWKDIQELGSQIPRLQLVVSPDQD